VGQDERAVVTYPAPHGTDAVTLCDDSTVAFGRGAECEIRFGYAPVADESVPRLAGRLVVASMRVFVESAAQPGHRAVEVLAGGNIRQLGPGEGFSPRERHFEVVVRGDSPWRMGVTVRPGNESAPNGVSVDPPTRRFSLDLTDQQFAVLSAYCEPPGRSRAEPATHKEVAASLNYHPNRVREILYDIWAKMFEEQVPMLDVGDKRVAVVEAARAHGLLWNKR
jgi:hypothetical protein